MKNDAAFSISCHVYSPAAWLLPGSDPSAAKPLTRLWLLIIFPLLRKCSNGTLLPFQLISKAERRGPCATENISFLKTFLTTLYKCIPLPVATPSSIPLLHSPPMPTDVNILLIAPSPKTDRSIHFPHPAAKSLDHFIWLELEFDFQIFTQVCSISLIT